MIINRYSKPKIKFNRFDIYFILILFRFFFFFLLLFFYLILGNFKTRNILGNRSTNTPSWDQKFKNDFERIDFIGIWIMIIVSIQICVYSAEMKEWISPIRQQVLAFCDCYWMLCNECANEGRAATMNGKAVREFCNPRGQ